MPRRRSATRGQGLTNVTGRSWKRSPAHSALAPYAKSLLHRVRRRRNWWRKTMTSSTWASRDLKLHDESQDRADDQVEKRQQRELLVCTARRAELQGVARWVARIEPGHTSDPVFVPLSRFMSLLTGEASLFERAGIANGSSLQDDDRLLIGSERPEVSRDALRSRIALVEFGADRGPPCIRSCAHPVILPDDGTPRPAW